MADIKGGQIVYDIIIKQVSSNASTIQQAEKSLDNFGKKAKQVDKDLQGLGNSAGLFGGKLKGIGVALIGLFAVDKLVQFGKSSVQAFNLAQQSAIQFNNAMQNVAGTTKEQINDLNDYIQVLEKKTSIDDKQIRIGAQVFAQDQINADNIKKLLPGLLDIAVANKDVGEIQDKVRNTAVALGRALATGNITALTKQNIVGIDEQTAKTFELGNQTERTAILVKIMAENGKGAAEAYGNSLQGSINKANDAVEDLQVSIGEGLNIAFNAFTDDLNTSTDGLSNFDQVGKSVSKGVVFLSLALSTAVKVVVSFGKFLALGVGELYSFGKVGVSAGKDIIKSFGNIAVAVKDVVSGLGKAVTGDFSGALESFKKASEIKIDFSETKQSAQESTLFIKELNDSYTESSRSIGESITKLVNFNQTYDKYKDATIAITKAKDAEKIAEDESKKAKLQSKEATDKAKQAQKDAAQELENYKKKLISTREEMIKTADTLKNNLSDSFKKFGETIVKDIEESQTKLAEIVVNAEQKKKELEAKIAQGGDIADSQKELAKVQEVLNARIGYEQRATEQIEAIRKRLADAGLDPKALNLDALKNTNTLQKEIEDQRVNATLNEFQLFEKNQNAKLLKLTNDFILEATLIKQKIDKHKELETEITEFVISKNVEKTQSVEAFANASILKYGQMASSLRDLISLQSQISTIQQNSQLPQFHDGGYVGSAGGEVHPGEFVVPANIVSQMPELISALDKSRNQTNSIVINGSMGSGTDLRSLTEEMLWKLRRV